MRWIVHYSDMNCELYKELRTVLDKNNIPYRCEGGAAKGEEVVIHPAGSWSFRNTLDFLLMNKTDKAAA